MDAEVREPAVAGTFYEADPKKLRKQIESSFLHRLGPGKKPEGNPGNKDMIIAAQVPHAGYMFSGPAAAHAYLALFEDTKPDTIIIIGPNHTGLGMPISVYPKGSWKTPLGEVEIDEEITEILASHKGIDPDFLAHMQEHSIEVQLPFLQYLYGNGFKLVPIAMMDQSISAVKVVTHAILDVLNSINKRIVIIASSDMTHYESQESAYKKDQKALDYIQALDVGGLYEYAKNVDLSMCGIGPVSVAMTIAQELGGVGQLLKYYTSGDITGDKAFVVGYASVIFSRGLFIIKKNVEKEEIPPVEEAYLVPL